MRRWRTGPDAEREQDQEANVTVLLEDIDQDDTARDSQNQQARRPSRRHRRPLKARSPEAGAMGAGQGDQDQGQERTADSLAQPPGTDRKDGRGPKWVRGLLAEPPRGSRADAEREAALALRESMTPAMHQLLLDVPGSTTPEEAGSSLAQRAGLDYTPSPNAEPSIILDLRNTPDMGAYPDRDKLSNRVLRLTNRRWAKLEQPSWDEAISEKRAIAEQEWAQRPVGTQRCQAVDGGERCRGVFVHHAEDQSEGTLVYCPTCGGAHRWDPSREKWTIHETGPALAEDSGSSP